MQSETKEIDVFGKNIGMNNEEMWKQCELLKSVAFQTIESKSGKGKNVRIVKEYKHNIPSEVMDRISNSCEYYKNLYEKEMKNRKIGSLEVIKYRFEKIDGEPKIIIDMIKVLDENGCYIKFAKLEKVLNFLSKYPIKFKDNVRT